MPDSARTSPASRRPARGPRRPPEQRSPPDEGIAPRPAFPDALEAVKAFGPDVAELGFMSRLLVQVTMPHSRPDSTEVLRVNGHLRLSMVARQSIGLPYGSYPRLLMSWLATEAVRTRSPELELGDSVRGFMARLGLASSGGKNGSATALRNQMTRLFGCAVAWTVEAPGRWINVGMNPVEATDLWWDPRSPEQIALWRSKVVLNARFFKELIDRPVPVDMRALRALSRSPMALDIYSWLTYRMSYLERDQLVSWELLQLQFGADYKLTRQFKAAFVKRLHQVLEIYPTARVSPDDEGLILSPSPTHVPRLHRA